MLNIFWNFVMFNVYFKRVKVIIMIYKVWDEKENKGFLIGLK